jgi:hypothetical protein
MPQTFSLLPGQYALTRLPPDSSIPDWVLASTGFVSITRTSDELSVVCSSQLVPAGARSDDGWCCLKLRGPFAFDQVGILSSFCVPLAQSGIGIFAISTFDTDYILVKQHQRAAAVEALLSAGHALSGDG